ncbi:TerC family protein [Catellatospora sp. TT07R-123]|uniref:TerC family protein n=1 Tax=Catellatospora sp. TT07R-123 TaxID=2733863 RepID=UPI001BB37957|nr:TerC family protein [Catellatospora sp. TT07R-123]
MNVSAWVWAATLVGLTALLMVDLLIIGRRPHEPSMKEATGWVVFYVLLACAFGGWIFLTYGSRYGQEFFAGWVTEYSLSVDNLFVFVIIMSRFAVPRIYQQKVLLIGIVLALLMRGAFIAAGAALVTRFVWVFYLFGLFLIYTAWQLTRHGESDESDFKENLLIRWSRRVLPISEGYDGARMTTHVGAKRMFTPMLVVMIAIGTTDLIFALDSIPAIFGLTKEPYLVFAANVFALMGLRQLYFLLGGLLDRLVYLSLGLAAVLGFIGVKLIMEALAGNNVPFINGGEPITAVPHISIGVSLGVIVAILGIATVASLIKSSREPKPTERTPTPVG